MEIKDLLKKNIFYIVTIGILILVLVLSVVLFNVNRTGKHRVFIFPSADEGKYILETRYLPENEEKDEITSYVDEILLGSGMERTRMLFTPGTKTLSCFEREGTLYLDLSEELINMGSNVIEIKDGIDLLEKNIKKNFSRIKSVKIFVNGKYAYDYPL